MASTSLLSLAHTNRINRINAHTNRRCEGGGENNSKLHRSNEVHILTTPTKRAVELLTWLVN